MTLDLSLCIALGRPFHGSETTQGRVTCVISEGGAARFAERVLAWCKHNKVDRTELDGCFEVVPVRVGIDNELDLKAFIAKEPSPRSLLVFDTLARSMDGDENSTQDMNAAIKGFDRVRDQYNATVLVVHHSGKNEQAQGRGSTVLPGAVDATLKVDKDKSGHTVLRLEESRNSETGKTFVFEAVTVVFGEDLSRTSIAMRSVELPPAQNPSTAEDRILVALVTSGGGLPKSFFVDENETGMSKLNVNKALRILAKSGLIDGGDPYFPTEKGIEEGKKFGAFTPDHDRGE